MILTLFQIRCALKSHNSISHSIPLADHWHNNYTDIKRYKGHPSIHPSNHTVSLYSHSFIHSIIQSVNHSLGNVDIDTVIKRGYKEISGLHSSIQSTIHPFIYISLDSYKKYTFPYMTLAPINDHLTIYTSCFPFSNSFIQLFIHPFTSFLHPHSI